MTCLGRRKLGCLWSGSREAVRSTGRLLGRAVMGTTVSSASSPEPDDSASVAERVVMYLEQKPLRLHNMLKVTK
ncbi:hypothetical protein QR680_018819 [Steinernema hermaphroditum]|uniref:Uncharacterized protein n=1 Tax=Steinernema hermaphroditum TaxID=289476 RepID=A0AA39LRL2_9BILA|nr:hypothetical protein QR680_018819 [Steinernema hermaphroditum]